MTIAIRQALIDEVIWINEKYNEIGFALSNFDNEHIAIAEIDGIPVGLGRIIFMENEVTELGGIYVFEHYRNQGIARHIVTYLMSKIAKNKKVYCVPFSHLEDFYCQFGFVKVVSTDEIPQEIANKYLWCQQHDCRQVSLLMLPVSKGS